MIAHAHSLIKPILWETQLLASPFKAEKTETSYLSRI